MNTKRSSTHRDRRNNLKSNNITTPIGNTANRRLRRTRRLSKIRSYYHQLWFSDNNSFYCCSNSWWHRHSNLDFAAENPRLEMGPGRRNLILVSINTIISPNRTRQLGWGDGACGRGPSGAFLKQLNACRTQLICHQSAAKGVLLVVALDLGGDGVGCSPRHKVTKKPMRLIFGTPTQSSSSSKKHCCNCIGRMASTLDAATYTTATTEHYRS